MKVVDDVSSEAGIDEPLRLRALAHLGPHGDASAREMLETGLLFVEYDVLGWEGSHGSVHGHRVTVRVPPAVYEAARAASLGRGVLVATDALSAAIAAAMAEREGQSLADLRIEVDDDVSRSKHWQTGPYRTSG